MKKKKKRLKIKKILFFITILIFLYYIIDNLSYNKDYLNSFTNESNVKLNKNLENKIIEYMDLYFSSMTTLKEKNMSYLFDNKEEAYINQTAISTLVNIRKIERNDMRIRNAKYDIIIKDIQKNDSNTTITFLENDYLHFNFMKNIESKVYDIENVVTFNKDNKIIKFRKTQDFYIMITNKYEDGKSLKEAKKELDNIKNNPELKHF